MFSGFLGILFGAWIWEVKQGSDFNFDPDAVGLYNSLASDTKATTGGLSAILQATAFGVWYWIVTLALPPLCYADNGDIVLDKPNSIGNGTCGISLLASDTAPKEIYTHFLREGNIYDKQENFWDLIITGSNQLFQPFAIYRDLIVTTMKNIALYLFWAICSSLLAY